MDHALPVPAGLDRRTIVRLLLAGATGAALAEAGIPMSTQEWDGPRIALDSLNRTLTGIAAGYDTWGPAKAAAALRPTELSMQGVFAGYTTIPEKRLRDAKALYARMLTLSATAANALGDHRTAVRTAELAASLAYETGDTQTAAHAWGVASGALRNSGKTRDAIHTARRAHFHAGSTPSAPMALLEEAFAAVKVGDHDAALDALAAAERAEDDVPPELWGTPGYPFGTYHPAVVKAYVGWALTRMGMYREAAPRLEEAASLLTGTRGLKRAFVWMTQASTALGTGDADAAHDFAALAVASAEERPARWVVAHVATLDRQARGAFADLVEQTGRWGFTTTS